MLGDENTGLYNASGRGFPDVAALGNNVETVFQGTQEGVAGTSASAPIFASMIALINDQLLAAGQQPLGWLNPFLYGVGASAFNDITVGKCKMMGLWQFVLGFNLGLAGQNPACGSATGFPAQPGWDPVCCSKLLIMACEH
jgi:tripeptidyl-peptidase-1